MRIIRFALIATIVLVAESSQKYDVLVEGKLTTEVSSRKVKLSDLAKITPISNLDLALALGSLEVVESLSPGQTLTLKGQDVVQKIEEKGFKLDAIGYVFPSEFYVSRTVGQISKEDVKEFILKTALKDRDVEALEVRLNSVALPSDSKILDLVDFTQTNQKLNAKLLVGSSDEAVTLDAEVIFREFKNVPVFAFSVEKGQKITEDMLALRRVGINSVLKDALPLEECVGKVLKADVQAGEVCVSSKTMKELLVRKNEPIEVVYSSGALEVKMLGESLSDAGLGDIVLVKNPYSGRIVQGVLSKDKKVLIQ